MRQYFVTENCASNTGKSTEDRFKRIATSAMDVFRAATTDYQTLIRDILREERDVMHLRRRSDIHQRLYEHIKRVIK